VDQILAAVEPVLRNALTGSRNTLALIAAALVAVIILGVPLLILTKRRGSTFRFEIGTSPASESPTFDLVTAPASGDALADAMLGDQTKVWQPAGQPWNDRREQMLRNLDAAERGLGRFYAVLLCVVIAALTGVAVFGYLKLPDDGTRQFLVLYGGVAYAILMLLALSQLFAVMRRISPPPDFLTGMRSRININVQTAPQVQFLDNQALDRAQRHLDAGGTLDEACALADPRYRSMTGMMRTLFQTALRPRSTSVESKP
jgi:hypothetical protein